MKNLHILFFLLFFSLSYSQEDDNTDYSKSMEESTSTWLQESKPTNSNNSQGGTKDNGQGQHNGVTDNSGNHYGWDNNPPATPISDYCFVFFYFALLYGLYSIRKNNRK